MGDKSQVQTYAPLLAFLEQHGVDLGSSGSAERGLSRAATLKFLGLLAERKLRVLGVEPWRKIGVGFSCDAQSVWIPADDKPSIEAAEQHVRQLELHSGDVVTVQFR